MVEKTPRKALIIYASLTGNTEKIATKFKEVIETKGMPWGEWQCDVFKATKNSYKAEPPFYAEDYEFICVGAPIWAGIPPLYLYDDHQGVLMKMLGSKTGPRMRIPPSQPYTTKKGVAFVTYGGDRRGTEEALPALRCLQLRMEDERIKCVGKFACPGGLWAESSIDKIAARFDWQVGDTSVAVSRYKENPNAEEFTKLTAEDRKLFESASRETGKKRPSGWHWDGTNRPHSRDLLKAQIFMEEILEDYFGGGIERYPFCEYLSIA